MQARGNDLGQVTLAAKLGMRGSKVVAGTLNVITRKKQSFNPWAGVPRRT